MTVSLFRHCEWTLSEVEVEMKQSLSFNCHVKRISFSIKKRNLYRDAYKLVLDTIFTHSNRENHSN